MTAFIFCLIIGFAISGFGIYTYFRKKETAFGFWSNAKMFSVNNIKAYNHALGLLWFVCGIIFAILGLPLLKGQNSPIIIITILGVMIECIITMIIYVTVIEKKYRTK